MAEKVFDPRSRPKKPLAEIKAMIGTEIGVSSWITVTQEMVDKHADASHDWNFVHVDPEMTRRETDMPGTIAHGFLTLSLLSAFAYEVMPVPEGITLGLNYGLDKARMITPVPVGGRVRGRFTLADIQEKPGSVVAVYDAVVELEGAEKPALVARWLTFSAMG